MVDIAQEAFETSNFDVSAAIYQNLIEEEGPSVTLLIGLADSLARQGHLDKALPLYMKAFSVGLVTPDMLKNLVLGLIDLVRGKEDFVPKPPAVQSDACALSKKPEVVELEADPFLCAICHCILLDAVSLPCGHSFCKRCLERENTKRCARCGVVHVRLDLTKLNINVLLTRIVDKWLQSQSRSVRLKHEGNDLFEQKKYREALEKYTEAFNADGTDHTLLSNRSCAHAALAEYALALADSELVINLKPDWPKGYYRKGVALSGLGRHDEAAVCFLQCLTIDSNIDSAKDALAQCLHKSLSPVQPESMKPSELQVGSRSTAMQALSQSAFTSWQPQMGTRRTLAEAILGKSSPPGASAANTDDKPVAMESESSDGAESSTTSVPREIPREVIDPEDFECSLCYRLLHEPVTTPCGHTYCRQCLDRCMDHNPSCPKCRFLLAEFLAERLTSSQKNVTTAIQSIIHYYLPEESKEREAVYGEEMNMLAQIDAVENPFIPIFVCTIGYPAIPCPLHIFEPRYRLMVRRAIESGTRQFGMCMSNGPEYADVGIMLIIRDVKFFPDGRSIIDTVGGRRFRVLERSVVDGYHHAKVEFLKDIPEYSESLRTLCNQVYSETDQWVRTIPSGPREQILKHFGDFPANTVDDLTAGQGPSWVWWVVAVMPLDPRAQLAILGMKTLRERLNAIRKVLVFVKSKSA